MNDALHVSVIIPVYNGERYLGEAIASALGQTYPPLEVIVVDDGSTDGSAAIAQGCGSPVRYDHQSHRPSGGAAAARNRGAELARGELLAFLDADDVWLPDKLARQVAAIRDDVERTMVFGHVRQFISPELEESVKAAIVCPPDPAPGLAPGALLIARATFLATGLFDPGWGVGEFIDWYLRAVERGLKTVMLADVVMLRRLHRTNQGILQRDARLDYVRIVKAARDRRRDQAGRETSQNRGEA